MLQKKWLEFAEISIVSSAQGPLRLAGQAGHPTELRRTYSLRRSPRFSWRSWRFDS